MQRCAPEEVSVRKFVLWPGLMIVTLGLLGFGTASAGGLTPHSAEYKVKISVLSGRLHTRLAATETGFEATHRIVPTGFARMISKGRIEEFSGFDETDSGVLPVRYRSSDSLSKDKTQADVEFDWSAGAIVGTVNNVDFNNPIDNVVHDRVSIQYELMHDLMNGGTSGTYVLFDIDEFKTLNVSVIGSRQIKTPAGSFDAVGVRHQAEGSSRVTTLWCVEKLGYLPVLIEQHRKGKLKMRASLTDYVPATVEPDEQDLTL